MISHWQGTKTQSDPKLVLLQFSQLLIQYLKRSLRQVMHEKKAARNEIGADLERILYGGEL